MVFDTIRITGIYPFIVEASMRSVVIALVALSVSFVGNGNASEADSTVIEYTSPVGGNDDLCPTQRNVYGAAISFVDAMTNLIGQDVMDPILYCGEIPSGATSVDVRISDDMADSVVVTLSQLDVNNDGYHDRFCDAATVPIDPESVAWTLHILPYGQTSQLCMDAGVPTHGFVTLAWA